MEQSESTKNQLTSLPAPADMGEEIDPAVDPMVAAMLEEANQAFEEGIAEQEAFDRDIDAAFESIDSQDVDWNWTADGSDRSVSVASVRSAGFGSLPDEFRTNSDDARSTGTAAGSADFDFSASFQQIGRRPILKPKTRVKAARAEKNEVAGSTSFSMMPPTNAGNNPAAPAISFPSNPLWYGAPIPSSARQTLTFMGVTTTVPVLSDTNYLELVPVGATDTIPASSGAITQESVGTSTTQQAQADLAALKQNLIATGVREACLKADVRRLGEDLKIAVSEKATLEAELNRVLHEIPAMKENLSAESRALIEQLMGQQDQTLAVQMAEMKQQLLQEVQQVEARASKEMHVLRGALDASRKMCNDLNKEKTGLDLAVSQLAKEADLRNKELELRTQERDYALQKFKEAEFHVNEASEFQSRHYEQIASTERKIKDLEAELSRSKSIEHKTKNLEAELGRSTILENKIKSLEAELDKSTILEHKIKSLEAELDKSTTLEHKIKNLEAELGESTRERDIAQQKMGELERKANDNDAEKWMEKYHETLMQLNREKSRSQAYWQDSEDARKERDIAREKITEHTATISQMTLAAERSASTISHLNQTIKELKNEVDTSKETSEQDIAKHESLINSVRQDLTNMKLEKEYIDDMLMERNQECNTLKEVSERDKYKIVELEAKLKQEMTISRDLRSKLQNSRFVDETKTVSQVSSRYRAHQTKGFPRAPSNNKGFGFPTLQEQLDELKEDDGSTEKLKQLYLNSYGPDLSNKYKDTATGDDEPSKPYKETVIEYVDKPVMEHIYTPVTVTEYVDKIIEHNVHQARSPLWAFLYVYIDLWTIFISYFVHHFPEIALNIAQSLPTNIANRLFSYVPSKVDGLTLIDILPTINSDATKLPNIDVESQTEPSTAGAASQTPLPKDIHKLPSLWPNLTTFFMHLAAVYFIYQCAIILNERHIWLSANEITRSTVSQFWGREPGFFGGGGGSSRWRLRERLCFWIIQRTGYSYTLPG